LAEFPDLTGEGAGDLHDRSVDPDAVSYLASKVFEGLPEGSAGLGI
jgi:hypothetical protein